MRRERKYYYEILGLNPGASNAEVKSAYRSLVKLYHPDKDPSPDSEVMYNEIRVAYERLMNWDNSDRTRSDPIYQPPRRETQTTSGSHDDSKQKVVWRTVETSTGFHYRTDRIPFKWENFLNIFSSSLSELTLLEIFGTIAAFGFACIIIIGKPYIIITAIFYIVSWVMFVFIRYYFVLSAPYYEQILMCIVYGIIVSFLVACLSGLPQSSYGFIISWTVLFSLMFVRLIGITQGVIVGSMIACFLGLFISGYPIIPFGSTLYAIALSTSLRKS